MIIYKATNKSNGKSYIGLTTKGLETRKRTHVNDARRGNTYFNRAIRKYGVEGFDWSEIDSAKTLAELREKEIYHINKYDTFDNKERGYNTTSGGQIFRVTEEEKVRRSERATGKNNPMFGIPSPMAGKRFTKEHRRRMSEASKGKRREWTEGANNPAAVPVIELTTMRIFGTNKEACEAMNISSTWLKKSIDEDVHVKGFKFQEYYPDREYKRVPKKQGIAKGVHNLTTGKTYRTITEAVNEYQCGAKGISDCCKGFREEFLGEKWEFVK